MSNQNTGNHCLVWTYFTVDQDDQKTENCLWFKCDKCLEIIEEKLTKF